MVQIHLMKEPEVDPENPDMNKLYESISHVKDFSSPTVQRLLN